MSPPGRHKHRREMLYDDPVDCGIYTLSKDRSSPDLTRTVSHTARTPSTLSIHALFDGHGAATAAELCARNFVPTLLDDPQAHVHPEQAIQNACEALEAFVLAKSALDRAYYGTTALIAVVRGSTLYIANLGNSRAVLVSRDSVSTLTDDHSCENPAEVARVQAAGAFFQNGRVNNLVRVTRSIGDLELKDRKHVTFPSLNLTTDVLIARPDIYIRSLSARDHFVVLATPQVWDRLTESTVATLARDALRRRDPPRVAARKIAAAATAAGARGAVTVMVLVFSPSLAPAAAADVPRADKAVTHARRRSPRTPTGNKRHSSNAEQELQSRTARGGTGTTLSVASSTADATSSTTERQTGQTTTTREGVQSASQPHLSVTKPLAREADHMSTPFGPLDVPPTARAVAIATRRRSAAVILRVAGAAASERRASEGRREGAPTTGGCVRGETGELRDGGGTMTNGTKYSALGARHESVRRQNADSHVEDGNEDSKIVRLGEGTSKSEVDAGSMVGEMGSEVEVLVAGDRPSDSGTSEGGDSGGDEGLERVDQGDGEPASEVEYSGPHEDEDTEMIALDEVEGSSSAVNREGVPSHLSNVTGSGGATAEASSALSASGDVDRGVGETVDYGPTGPSKVRYRDDGTVHNGRLGFLRDFGRTFVRRR